MSDITSSDVTEASDVIASVRTDLAAMDDRSDEERIDAYRQTLRRLRRELDRLD
ncbi:hypothetical protein [Bifidobacterium simiarum]|uniref:hypothetical protein n=1 Tax=Bifidobacterium simiarum TaxID=2045441 RepID=UPI001BDDA9D4|nr:hypothetical protein [Bifidobacterium simiarum]MBT1165767.1 hypothetical protein [Bifidobacterium simiarum]